MAKSMRTSSPCPRGIDAILLYSARRARARRVLPRCDARPVPWPPGRDAAPPGRSRPSRFELYQSISGVTECLFAGGFVASQLTAGENKREGAMYGLFVWAAVFTILWLMATTARKVTQGDAEEAARRMGFTQQQIDEAKQKAKNAPADATAALEDPANKVKAQEAAREAGEVATRVTWWAFFGTLVSMSAAAAGGLVGAGLSFRLFAVPVEWSTFDRREAAIH